MPVDPTISLNVTGGKNGLSEAGTTGTTNPLSMVNSFADMQQRLNNLKLFNQSFAAKQKFGQIMSQSPDIPTAIERAQADPAVAAFVPELIQTMAATQNAMQSYRGQVQAQTADAFTHGSAALLSGLMQGGDPARLLKSYSNNIPDPGVRATFDKSMNNIMLGINDPIGLSEDPAIAKQQKINRFIAAAIGTGSLDAINKIQPAADQKNLGSQIQPGTTAGGLPLASGRAPGSFEPAGKPITITGSPGPVGQGSAYFGARPVGGRVGGGGTSNSSSGSILTTPLPLQSGKPMIPEGYKLPQLPLDRDATGQPMGPAANQIQDLGTAFTGPELRMFENAKVAKGQLSEMESNFDGMAAGGGFMTPGALGQLRLNASKLLNTFSQITGKEPNIDPSKIAKAEDILKGTERMGFSTLSTLLGDQQHAAAETVNHAVNAVPQLENSYLGAKLLINSIRATQDRVIDERNFKNWWQTQTKGDLRGAAEEFNRLHPAEDYIKSVLQSFGLDKNGFKHPQDVMDQYKKGYLTKEQAKTILQSQFPEFKGEGR